MGKVQVGLIGAGSLGRAVHLPILGGLPGVEVRAIAEASAENRKLAGPLAPSAKLVDDYQSLLAMSDVTAVVIALPTHLHASVAVAALQAGKNVYLEKPLSTGGEESQQVLDAWKASGKVGMVGLNYRFNPLVAQLKKVVATQIGKPVSVRTVFSTTASNAPAWKKQRKTGGGVLLDLATHHVDLVRFLFDQEVEQVSATISTVQAEHDTATLQLVLSGGLTVQSIFSLASTQEHSVEVFGTGGKASISLYRSLEVTVDRGLKSAGQKLADLMPVIKIPKTLPYAMHKRRSPWNEPSFAIALGEFVKACEKGHSLPPTFDDGYRAERVIDAAERSAESKQWVTPDMQMAAV